MNNPNRRNNPPTASEQAPPIRPDVWADAISPTAEEQTPPIRPGLRAEVTLPTTSEREASIRYILQEGLPEREGLLHPLRTVPFPALFAGVGDCLFLAALIALLCLLPASALAAKNAPAAPLLFLLSPALYALLHLLTAWKERMSGTLEWKQTCRVSFRALNTLRMLCFGGAALLLCVPQCLLLWRLWGESVPLLWMLGVSFSSLFLYGQLALSFLRSGLWLPPLLWTAAGAALLLWNGGAEFLLRVPAALFFAIAAGAAALCMRKLTAYLRTDTEFYTEGGSAYALR